MHEGLLSLAVGFRATRGTWGRAQHKSGASVTRSSLRVRAGHPPIRLHTSKGAADITRGQRFRRIALGCGCGRRVSCPAPATAFTQHRGGSRAATLQHTFLDELGNEDFRDTAEGDAEVIVRHLSGHLRRNLRQGWITHRSYATGSGIGSPSGRGGCETWTCGPARSARATPGLAPAWRSPLWRVPTPELDVRAMFRRVIHAGAMVASSRRVIAPLQAGDQCRGWVGAHRPLASCCAAANGLGR